MSATDTPPPASIAEAREQAAELAGERAPAEPDAKPKRTRTRAPRASSTPRKRAPRKRADRAPAGSTPKPPALKRQLEEALTSLGFMVMLVNARDGQLIMEGAAKQAAALDAWARANPRIEQSLRRMLAASVYGELAMAFAPTVVAIAANHGAFGASSPMVGMLVGGMAAGADAGAPTLDLAAMFRAPDASPPASSSPAPDAGGGEGAPHGVVTGADAMVGVH